MTLAVADLSAARAFYLDGLGWHADLDEVVMIRVADRLVLSLWQEDGFEAEVGPLRRGAGHPPITLAHHVATRGEVDQVLVEAGAAGASQVVEARRRPWGGYTGYFRDPAGFSWEVAWNPGPVGASVLP